jgi:hypothetical protein
VGVTDYVFISILIFQMEDEGIAKKIEKKE